MTSLFLDTGDDIASVSPATCCPDSSPFLILIFPLLCVGISAVALPFQYWIFKHPHSLFSKFLAGFLYLFGVILFMAGLVMGAQLFNVEDQAALSVSVGVGLGWHTIFFFLLTRWVSLGKRPNRKFWRHGFYVFLFTQILFWGTVYFRWIEIRL